MVLTVLSSLFRKTAVTTSITVEIRAVDINSYISLTLLKRFSISLMNGFQNNLNQYQIFYSALKI